MNRDLQLTMAYGRLYAKGKLAGKLTNLPGATWNTRRRACVLTLTLEMLRRIRDALYLSKEDMARACSKDVISWARAAAKSERHVKKVHEAIREGNRIEFPWVDNGDGEYRPPYEHQEVMASVAGALDGSGFLCDVGTGKTRAAVEALAHQVREGTIQHALVLCPKRVQGTWQRECTTWSNDLTPVVLTGRVEDRIARMQQGGRAGTVFILNYDVLYRMEKELQGAARAADGFALVLDEAHRVRNPQAKRTKACMKLAREADWRLIMTGSPVIQGSHDVWSQWYVVDLGITFGANFVQFRRQWFVENPYTFSLDPIGDAQSEIGIRMRRRGLRYRKDDCLDLPPKVYEVELCELTGEQDEAYRSMAEDLVAFLGDEGEAVTAAIQVTRILRLAQITSGFLPLADGKDDYRFEPNPKLRMLEELVREDLHGVPMVIWAWFKHDQRAIADTLDDLGVIRAWEHENPDEMFEAGEADIIVANQQSLGIGVDLIRANVAIYYSQNHSYEHRLQSEGRNHRSGSEVHNKVTYIDLVAEHTIDEIIREAIANKREVAEIVVDLKHHLETL